MGKQYLVIIDNGLDYSDHTHMAIASCATEADATELAKRLTDELRETAALRGNEGYLSSFDIQPEDMPLARSLDVIRGWHSWNHTTYTVLPVPTWAQS